MKAALLKEDLSIKIGDVPTPELKRDEVMVRVRACGVCATDVKKFTGASGTPHFPFILGHEPAGIVEAVGADVDKDIQVGTRAAVAPVIVCGECDGCVSGLVAQEGMGMCENYHVVGYSGDGAFAEYITVPPENVFPIPDALSFRDAALVEPVAACANGVFKALKSPPGKAVVLGAGFMGLASLALLKLLGAQVLIADLLDERLETAKMLGADAAVNPGKVDLMQMVMDFTGGKGADSVLCAVGVKSLTEQGLAMLAKAGRLVLLASGPKGTKIEVDLNNAHYYHPVITGSVSYTAAQFSWVINQLAAGAINTDLLVTHTGGLESVEKFLTLTTQQEGLKKVLLMGGD